MRPNDSAVGALRQAPDLAIHTRLLGSGRSNKNDPNDARSVAMTALRHRDLRAVRPAGYCELLRLLAKRHVDLSNQRTRLVARLHALAVELSPGGILQAAELDRRRQVPRQDHLERPGRPFPRDLIGDIATDIANLEAQIKRSDHRIHDAVRASGTTLTDIFGIGPIIAAMLIGSTGDVARFTNRDRYAAYNGTAPTEFSSGGRVAHRVSRRGNRTLNHALHLAAICQLRHPGGDGRVYFERRDAEGKTRKEAVRALKRQLSNIAYRHLVNDRIR
jgi:transposase